MRVRATRVRAALALASGALLGLSAYLFGASDVRASGNAAVLSQVDLSSCMQGDPNGVILVCGDVPDGYQLPEAPPLPAELKGSVFVAFPSLVPDEGQLCPLPQDLGSNVLGTMCGPVPAEFTLPLPPTYDKSICAKAEAKLADMKSEAVAAGVKDVSSSFPDYDPQSCRVWSPPSVPEPGMSVAVVRFKALDPTAEVPPVIVDLGGQS
jgi:hypothetical protein